MDLKARSWLRVGLCFLPSSWIPTFQDGAGLLERVCLPTEQSKALSWSFLAPASQMALSSLLPSLPHSVSNTEQQGSLDFVGASLTAHLSLSLDWLPLGWICLLLAAISALCACKVPKNVRVRTWARVVWNGVLYTKIQELHTVSYFVIVSN